jgi:PPK2 family polyphosphate:nucleotide phosphotransferase
MDIDPTLFRHSRGRPLDSYPTRWRDLPKAEQRLAESVGRLSEIQERLWADNRYAVLLIFQGMDTAGKDGTIKHVTSGCNPAGFQVFGFRQPSPEELDHDYLWRYWRALPERGRIGIFNRSYYEEVLVVRVHPEIIDQRPLPHEHVDEVFWAHRLEDIAAMERHLWRNGTRVLKFFLHLSPEEQRRRLLARLENREKLWKFDPSDLEARDRWDDFQRAYQAALDETHDVHAPWFVIPADDKSTMRAVVSEIIATELERLDLHYPTPPRDDDGWVDAAVERLRSS